MKRILLTLLALAAPAAAQVSGDILYNTKNAGAGSTLRYFTPSTSTDLLGLNGSGLITRIPQSTFATASHTQAISTITGLQTALDDKASLTGTYNDPSWLTGLAWSKLGSVPAAVTAIGTAGIGTGVLTGNGSVFSYTATSTGGNTFGTDAGKIAVYSDFGELAATSAIRLTSGPTVMGIWFGSHRLASSASGLTKTWTLPNVTGTLITNNDTGTVTSAMLASGAAASLGANTFTGLQQFSGTDHAGLRLNNLTTTQRDAIGTPAAGMVIWNTTVSRIQAYNGSAWTAGMVRLDGDTMTGTLILPAGTVSAPSLTFGDSTSGIYRSASGEVALTSGGTQRLRSTSSGVTVTGTLTVGAGSIQDMGGGQLALGGSHYASGNGFFATTLLRISTSGLGAGNKAQWGVLAEGAAIQRDAANAQAFYVANTYTSTTSYEAAGIRWSSNVAIFGPVKGSGGGSSRNAQYHTTETGVFWSSGTGSPESIVTAPVGSVYTRTDGGANTTLYIKESGTGNTGWIAK